MKYQDVKFKLQREDFVEFEAQNTALKEALKCL